MLTQDCLDLKSQYNPPNYHLLDAVFCLHHTLPAERIAT